jgi:2-hydroxychromene-2-carboxylate isomerase
VPQQPVFYYDLGSPQCYLVGETIMSTLPVVPEWEPVLASRITGSEQQSNPDRDEVERLAAEFALQPIRWPTTWPPDTTRAMLAASYAKRIGRGVAFSLAAFRQTFAGGRDIGDENTVLIAGAACEMHPVALTKGIELKSTSQALQAAGERAIKAGVRCLPAIQVGTRTYEGPDALSEATTALAPETQR